MQTNEWSDPGQIHSYQQHTGNLDPAEYNAKIPVTDISLTIVIIRGPAGVGGELGACNGVKIRAAGERMGPEEEQTGPPSNEVMGWKNQTPRADSEALAFAGQTWQLKTEQRDLLSHMLGN